MNPMVSIRWIAVILVCLVFLTSCMTAPPVVQPPPLRTGVVRDYPPLVFKTDNGYAGIEAELASLLGAEIGRPVQFVEYGFDEQTDALLGRQTDIIMTGMTVTRERKMRINFADYYLKSGLALAVRLDSAKEFGSLEDILERANTVGVIGTTTAEAYVRRTFPASIRVLLLGKPSDAPYALKNRKIDVYVDDAPSIGWLVSSNASEVKGLFQPLTEFYYAWGIRKDDERLLEQANAVIAKWKKDGTLTKVLKKWLPYSDDFF
jgi:polar amino acid transport system substrate-binding protein